MSSLLTKEEIQRLLKLAEVDSIPNPKVLSEVPKRRKLIYKHRPKTDKQLLEETINNILTEQENSVYIPSRVKMPVEDWPIRINS